MHTCDIGYHHKLNGTGIPKAKQIQLKYGWGKRDLITVNYACLHRCKNIGKKKKSSNILILMFWTDT